MDLVGATYLFPNSMVATFDRKGNQIGELQGRFCKELLCKIIEQSDQNTQWTGYEKMRLLFEQNQ